MSRYSLFFPLLVIVVACDCYACPYVAIDDRISLAFCFPNQQPGDTVQVVWQESDNGQTLDTLPHVLPTDLCVNFGRESPYPLSPGGDGREVFFNYTVILPDGESHAFSNIQMEEQEYTDNCACLEYSVESLEIDGDFVRVNNQNYRHTFY